MDDKWFKKRQKMVGVTAEDIANKLGRDRSVVSRIYIGRQEMNLKQAEVFAEVLEVPLRDVLEHAGISPREDSYTKPQGFSEGDAVMWHGKGDREDTNTICARAFGGGRPGIDVWKVSSRALELDGLLPGDFFLANTHLADQATTGDHVVAQRYDTLTGGAVTMIRRFEPPVLVSSSTDPGLQRTHIVDNDVVAIRAKIIASWRQS